MSVMDRIRRRETPLYDWLYRTGKAARRWELPYVHSFWRLMGVERSVRLTVWHNLRRVLYVEPMFRSQLAKVGPGLWVYGRGVPQVVGSPVIEIGRNFRLCAPITISAHKNAPRPRLVFGDDCGISSGVTIAIGSEIICGDRVRIAMGTHVAGYGGHPLDPDLRAADFPDDVPEPIHIGSDAWIASGCFIRGGVSIGEAAIVAARSVVTRDVPAGALVAGNPARVIRESVLEDADTVRRLLGHPGRYEHLRREQT